MKTNKIEIVPNLLYAMQLIHTKEVKLNGEDLTPDEWSENFCAWCDDKPNVYATTEITTRPTEYRIEAYLETDDEFSLSTQSRIEYKECIEKLLKKYNIETDFNNDFISMITDQDYAVVKLRGLDLSECEEELHVYLNSLYEYHGEDLSS